MLWFSLFKGHHILYLAFGDCFWRTQQLNQTAAVSVLLPEENRQLKVLKASCSGLNQILVEIQNANSLLTVEPLGRFWHRPGGIKRLRNRWNIADYSFNFNIHNATEIFLESWSGTLISRVIPSMWCMNSNEDADMGYSSSFLLTNESGRLGDFCKVLLL